MNAAKAAAVALIAFSGVAIPTSGAVHANGDEPLLCGLLSPCEEGSDDGSGDDAEPEPVDIELDLELDLDLGIGHDGGSDADAIGDVDANAGVQLFPQHGTLLDADADVQPAVVDASVLHRTLGLESDTGVDTDAHLGHDGAVVTGSGFANAQAGADAGQKLVGVAAANQLCGVQVVVAATSAAGVSVAASAGPPKGPATRRVSSTRQGVTA